MTEQTKQSGEAVGKVLEEHEYNAIGYDKRGGKVIWFGDLPFGAMLYTSSPTAQAYAAVMLQKAVMACKELANESQNSEQYRMGANWASDRIRALIPTDDMQALREFGMACIGYALDHENVHLSAPVDMGAIVNSVIEGKKV